LKKIEYSNESDFLIIYYNLFFPFFLLNLADLKVNCKPPSNLVELIEKDCDFEKELKDFESSFQQDKIVDT
jgi:hypothetical protein